MKKPNKRETKVPYTLEGAQIIVENVERLTRDSENVSNPTKFALLELALEELAKAWATIFAVEFQEFDNAEFSKTYKELAGVNEETHSRSIGERIKLIDVSENLLFESERGSLDYSAFANHHQKISTSAI